MAGNYKFSVQEAKKLRVIIDTDAACEADDQYAIVHALLTPKFVVKGIVAEQFSAGKRRGSVDESYNEITKVLSLMQVEGVPVVRGSDVPLASEGDSPPSEGADLIAAEALKADEKPLFVLCQGAATNVASALNAHPEIAGKFTCIWIGGGVYPRGCWEFNLTNDFRAANALFRSGVELWQVPMDCYSQMLVSYAELEAKVAPCGKIGCYLFDEMQEVGAREHWVSGESWALGDSPVVGLALNTLCGRYETRKSPVANEKGEYVGENENLIRVYREIDSRFILEDFFAKLKLNYGKA